jgi:nitrogen fixation NifU-like protein
MPRNLDRLAPVDGYARGVGSCGDAIEVFLDIGKGRVRAIRRQPAGCVYTVACARAMNTRVEGRTLEEALGRTALHVAAALDGLPPDHLHCAALAVNTLGEAIDNNYPKLWGRPARL